MPRSFLVKKTDDHEILSDLGGGQRNFENLHLSPGAECMMDAQIKDEQIPWKGEVKAPLTGTGTPNKPDMPPFLLQHSHLNRQTTYNAIWQGKAFSTVHFTNIYRASWIDGLWRFMGI